MKLPNYYEFFSIVWKKTEYSMLFVFVLEYLLCDFLFYMCFKKFSLLKGRDKDGFPVYQEKLIRESIRKFPYCEATLLQQLVRSIAPVEIVSFSC